MKISEDWLAVGIGFTLLVLTVLGAVNPIWVKF